MIDVSKKLRKYFYLVWFLGVILQVSLIFPSGIFWNGSYQFWGAEYHDGLWHVSLIQKLTHLSLENPVFAGERLRNYHYLTDLVIALFHNITGIHIFDVFFRIYPVFISLLIGLLTYKLAKKLFYNEVAAIWSVLFVYIGSNFAYLLPFFKLGNPILESAFWVSQPISIFTNIPFSASVPLILGSILSLKIYFGNDKKKYLILSSILLGLAPPTKSFSIIFVMAFGFAGFIRVFREKKIDLLLASIMSFIIATLIISPTFQFGKNFIFEPGWFLKTMIEAPDRMNWKDWALKYQFYKANYDIFNLAKFYIIAFLIFVFGNLGTRIVMIIGLAKIKDVFKDEIHTILLGSLFVSLLIPTLFITTGIAWNGIQFMYYFLMIAGFYSGYGLYKLVNKMHGFLSKIILVFTIVVLTTPINIHTLWFYYHHPAEVKIGGEELSALTNLSKTGNYKDVVLTFPLETSFMEVSAFTDKSTFLGDWLMAIVPGHDYQKRLGLIKNSMETGEGFRNLLSKNGIKWLYIKGTEPEIVNSVKDSLSIFYKGDSITIYHVEKI